MTIKYGLVLGGGGRNGAFSVGAAYRLMSEYNIKFQEVSGTSTGALMASAILLDNIELMNDIYRGGVLSSDIMEERGLISSFINSAMSDTSPLLEMIKRYEDKDGLRAAWNEGKKAYATITNLRTGLVIRYESSPENMDQWENYLLASASMPVLMDTVEIAKIKQALK